MRYFAKPGFACDPSVPCVYILRCGDSSLCTGITKGFPRRLNRDTLGRSITLHPCADSCPSLGGWAHDLEGEQVEPESKPERRVARRSQTSALRSRARRADREPSRTSPRAPCNATASGVGSATDSEE